MRHSILILIFLSMTFAVSSQDHQPKDTSEVSTYYFIRHAEKDRSDQKEKNPHLNAKGVARANQWSAILEHVKFDAIYATDYFRTKETAQPIASKQQIAINIYQPHHKADIDTILKNTKGQTVLIVGHSDTIPVFVNTVIGQQKYQDIDDSNNGNLYIVTLVGNKIADQVLTIN